VTINVNNVTYPNRAVANITTDVAGSYDVIINDRNYGHVTFTDSDVRNGKATKTINVELLDAHIGYEASVSFAGNDNYKKASDYTTFNVYKSTSSIDVDYQTITYGETVDILLLLSILLA